MASRSVASTSSAARQLALSFRQLNMAPRRSFSSSRLHAEETRPAAGPSNMNIDAAEREITGVEQQNSARFPRTFSMPGQGAFERFGRQEPKDGNDTQPDQRHPYKLHAHCMKNNTILSLTRALPLDYNTLDPRSTLESARDGTLGDGSIDPRTNGQIVARVSTGMLGFKKAQRRTYEAATRAALKMFELIEQVGQKDRKTKHGRKVGDANPTSIELVFKGYGQGRDALIAAIATAAGANTARRIKRITDATPIRIGGTRPKKRKMLSPPLDLSRRRR